MTINIDNINFSGTTVAQGETPPRISAAGVQDLFEILVPHQSPRPMSSLLGMCGIAVKRDSALDHILHGCLLGAIASIVAGICAPLIGAQYFPLMLGILVTASFLDVCGPKWARLGG